jgi:molybdopterin molybdotransferase
MISVQEALHILHENIPIPKTELVALEEAHDCILSIDVKAPESSPRYTNSAMDGFALRWVDCAEANKENPVTFKIIGESQAGIPFDQKVIKGTAIRISTGAMLPDGADTRWTTRPCPAALDLIPVKLRLLEGTRTTLSNHNFDPYKCV